MSFVAGRDNQMMTENDWDALEKKIASMKPKGQAPQAKPQANLQTQPAKLAPQAATPAPQKTASAKRGGMTHMSMEELHREVAKNTKVAYYDGNPMDLPPNALKILHEKFPNVWSLLQASGSSAATAVIATLENLAVGSDSDLISLMQALGRTPGEPVVQAPAAEPEAPVAPTPAAPQPAQPATV